MARKLPESQEILEWVRLSEAARARLGADAEALRHRLDVPARLRDSLRNHPVGWLGGTAIAGLAASRLASRALFFKTRATRRGWSWLGLGFNAVRPVAKIWLASQVKRLVEQKLAPDSQPLSRRR